MSTRCVLQTDLEHFAQEIFVFLSLVLGQIPHRVYFTSFGGAAATSSSSIPKIFLIDEDKFLGRSFVNRRSTCHICGLAS